MNMRASRDITEQMYSTIGNSLLRPVINIEKCHKIRPDLFSVVISSTEYSSKFSFEEFNNTLAELTDNTFSIVESSLFAIDPINNMPLYRCILAANVPSIEYNDEEIKKHNMIVIRANIFQDGDENMWRAIGEGATRRLVQMNQEDFAGLLEAKRQMNPVTAAFDPVFSYQDCDYVCFYNTEINAMDFGFVMCTNEGDLVLSRTNPEKLLPISADQVVEAALISKVEVQGKKDLLAPRTWKQMSKIEGTFSKSAFLDYMRSIYGNTPFFRALENAIRKNGVL